MTESDDYDEGDDYEAWARRSDPETSWEAARSQSSEKIRISQRDLLSVLLERGPITDTGLVEAYTELARRGEVIEQSPSGIRTRRHELVDRGLVVDTGEKQVLPTGRRAILWDVWD